MTAKNKQLTVILDFCFGKARAWKSHDHRKVKPRFPNVFCPHENAAKFLIKFLWFDERFRKDPIS